MDTKPNRLLELATDMQETREEWKAPELKKGEITVFTSQFAGSTADGVSGFGS